MPKAQGANLKDRDTLSGGLRSGPAFANEGRMRPNQHSSGKMRLDEALVARGLFASRSRARDAILRGTVSVDGLSETKPAQAVASTAEIAVADPARGYVSRAALKLVAPDTAEAKPSCFPARLVTRNSVAPPSKKI